MDFNKRSVVIPVPKGHKLLPESRFLNDLMDTGMCRYDNKYFCGTAMGQIRLMECREKPNQRAIVSNVIRR